jgi:hypothetical protein
LFIASAFLGPNWRDILWESISNAWGLTGWSVLFLSPLVMYISEHSQKKTPFKDVFKEVREFARSPKLSIPGIFAYLLFVGSFLYFGGKKFDSLNVDLTNEKRASLKLVSENSNLRTNVQRLKVEVQTKTEDPEARLNVQNMSNEIASLKAQIAQMNPSVKERIKKLLVENDPVFLEFMARHSKPGEFVERQFTLKRPQVEELRKITRIKESAEFVRDFDPGHPSGTNNLGDLLFTNVRIKLSHSLLQSDVIDIKRKLAPRQIDSGAFVAQLANVPKVKTEVLYQPGDYEAYLFASQIHAALGEPRGNMPGAGWNMMAFRALLERDELLGLATNGPLSARAGAGLTGIGIVVKKGINFEAFVGGIGKTNTDNPIAALENAFEESGHAVGMTSVNTNLDADVRIIISQKL